MTEAAEVSTESEAVAAERETPPGPITPWNRRAPGATWPPPIPAGGPPRPGAGQPSATPAVDALAAGNPPRTTPAAAPAGPGAPQASSPAGTAAPPAGPPAAAAAPVGAPAGPDAAARPDSGRVHSDSGERQHDDGPLSNIDTKALASAAPMLAMLPMMLSSLLGGAGGGSGSGGGAPQNVAGTTDSGQPTGGGTATADGAGTLSPQAQDAIKALRRLRDTYGQSSGTPSGTGKKPATPGVTPGADPGKGGTAGNGTAAALSAVQLYQRTAAIAFNNLDNQLAGYLGGLAGQHGINKAALTSLIKELDIALIKLGTAAYTPAGAQKVHDILTVALRQGLTLAGAGQVSAADTAAAIDGLTAQYLYNITGHNYPGTGVSGGGVSAAVQKVIAVATAQVGKPYVWGAEGPNSFDCSGLMQYAARAAGVNIPRVSQDQYRQLPKVNPADIRPGDLIFPAGHYNGGSPTHVMMYIGNGRCVEAPRTGLNVRIVALPSSYAASRWS
ncbi:C40 family peptidase [Nocardia sp. NPDC056000]|uniref:C40 family peptidase n=1 Tax=Nocardia sp. NPDC056000 TaxID=3345674 RepID=UPI0035D7728A